METPQLSPAIQAAIADGTTKDVAKAVQEISPLWTWATCYQVAQVLKGEKERISTNG